MEQLEQNEQNNKQTPNTTIISYSKQRKIRH